MGAQTRSDPINLLSVDLEDWPQSTLDQNLEISPRVVSSTLRLLEIFGRHGARATFFVLGLVAERFPELVREVRDAGHEVATHGTSHRSVAALGPEGFRADLQRSLRAIQSATGLKVLGYRAPDFSISEQELWALQILAEEGLSYDSSIFPFRGSRYGIPRAFRGPWIVRCPGGRSLFEFPLATVDLLGRRLPVAGGGYFRLLPYAVTRCAIKRIHRDRLPAAFYFHPYEIDPGEFRTLSRPVPLRLRLSQGIGRSRVQRRLERLLSEFRWAPMRDLLDRESLFEGRSLRLDCAAGEEPRWETT